MDKKKIGMMKKKKRIKLMKRKRRQKRIKYIITTLTIAIALGGLVYIPIKIKARQEMLIEEANNRRILEENKVLETFDRLKEDRKSVYATEDVLIDIDTKIEKITEELKNGVTNTAKELVDELKTLLMDLSSTNHSELEDLFNKINEDNMAGFSEEEINKVNTLMGEYNLLMKKQEYSKAKVILEEVDNYIKEVKKDVEKRITDEVYDKKSSEEASTREPTYINGILLVNKKNGLPDHFGNGEDPEARAAFEEMKMAAAADGIYINAFSTYRSYWAQDRLYSEYMASYGQEPTDTFSARPGFSEHQTGLAFDIGGVDRSVWAEEDFKYTEEAEWLKNNAYKYGFILRYPEGKEWKTGFMYESWHFRYIGKEHSKNFNNNNLTLEEYLGQ